MEMYHQKKVVDRVLLGCDAMWSDRWLVTNVSKELIRQTARHHNPGTPLSNVYINITYTNVT
jgi:translation initiation factor 2B subunit (eIF-2B alpha/beta/delta family)